VNTLATLEGIMSERDVSLMLGSLTGKQEGMAKELSELKVEVHSLADKVSEQHTSLFSIGNDVRSILRRLDTIDSRCENRHPASIKRPSEVEISAKAAKTALNESLGSFGARVMVKALEGVGIALFLSILYIAARLAKWVP
jgi:hypothetical protein